MRSPAFADQTTVLTQATRTAASQSDESIAKLLEWYILRIVKADLNRKNGIITDLGSRAALDRFRKAAKAFDKRVNRSPETARQMLISEGILTKSGKLSKNYR